VDAGRNRATPASVRPDDEGWVRGSRGGGRRKRGGGGGGGAEEETRFSVRVCMYALGGSPPNPHELPVDLFPR